MVSNEINESFRILVIDDNVAIHEDFRKILTKAAGLAESGIREMEAVLFGSKSGVSAYAFEIDCAAQGKEGLEMVRQAESSGNPYALAFVDGRMPPGWDGIETIGHLWRACPDLQVVLCTAYSDHSWHEIRRVLGDSDSFLILKKPFENVEVLQLAHALTRKWDLTRKVRNRIENLDETVRKRTEEKERTRVLLEAALEHSPAGVIVLDAKDGEIRWTNPAALRICAPASLLSSRCEIAPRSEDWRVFRADGTPYPDGKQPLMRAVANGETIQDEEIVLRDSQGREKWISSNAGPIRDSNGNIVAGILVYQDITERKRAEKEREQLQIQLHHAQKLESVGLLAGGIAHDFNNMLCVILGSAEIGLMQVGPNEWIYRVLKNIQDAAIRSKNLTQRLLAFARKQMVEPRVLNLNHKVEGMIEMLGKLIGEDIELLWKPEPAVWPVEIDPSQVDHIVVNLCVNARDAIAGVGKIAIETKNVFCDDSYCSVHAGFVPGHYAMLSISDDGVGIPKENLGNIFEPFFTTKDPSRGSGLGLATVYGIVRQNNGFVNVYSEPGQGTTFRIYYPKFQGNGADSAVDAIVGNCKAKGETVLLVEDEEKVLAVAESILEELGYTVLTARTPGEAFRQVLSCGREIQLLVTDVIMPEMNGRELAEKIIRLYPKMKTLFMSGYTAEIISRRGVLRDGVQLLQKPFTFMELAGKVRGVLDGK